MTDLHKMKLTHYSSNDKLVVSTMQQLSESMTKPQGLWVSVDGPDDWKEWCTSEHFRVDAYKHKYRIKLVKDTNVLLIDNVVNLRVFTELYVDATLRVNHGIISRTHIHWDAVAQRYGGIVIAPYQWSCRADERVLWYYSWDCASGCIWDLRCIREVKYEGECNFTMEERDAVEAHRQSGDS